MYTQQFIKPCIKYLKDQNAVMGTRPSTKKNTATVAMEFTIAVDPSLIIITIYSVCLTYAQAKKRHQFLNT